MKKNSEKTSENFYFELDVSYVFDGDQKEITKEVSEAVTRYLDKRIYAGNTKFKLSLNIETLK